MDTKKLREQLEKRLNAVEDAYNETDRPAVDFSVYPEDLRAYEQASYDAIVVVEAARKIERECGFGEIDWSNRDQGKWIPWFRMSPSAFAFYVTDYDYSSASAGSGSRLRVLSDEATEHIGRRFTEMWEKLELG